MAAAVLASARPPSLPKPSTTAPPIHSSRRNSRFPTPSSRTQTGLSKSLHACPGDWSFEQRMRESLAILDLMQSQSIRPDPALFCSLLKSCSEIGNLDFGRIIHKRVVECGLQHEPMVAHSLISLYAKCGLLGTARQLFEEMPVKSVISWTTLISSYHHAGFPHDALDIYRLMRTDGKVQPNAFTYAIALSSCARVGNLEMGIEIHEGVERDGCDTDDFVVVALIDMYAKAGRMDNARKVFKKLKKPTVASCTAMIQGCNVNGEAKEAMGVLRRIVWSGLLELRSVGELGLPALVKSCLMEMALRQGQEIHAHIVKFEHQPGMETLSHLVELYVVCDEMSSARQLFNGVMVKKESLWHRMGLGYVNNGFYGEALKVFSELVSRDAAINQFTVSWALEACVGLIGLEEGRQIHGRLFKVHKLVCEDSVVTRLIDLYEKCGQHEEAHRLTKHHRWKTSESNSCSWPKSKKRNCAFA